MSLSTIRFTCATIATCSLVPACVTAGETTAQSALSAASAEFSSCVESVYAALVATANARPLVPAHYVLVGDGAPVTPLVVRTMNCGAITVAGENAGKGAIAQIGLLIVPPDGTGDVNLYQLWYDTNVQEVAHAFRDGGLPARYVQSLDERYTPCTTGACTFDVTVPAPADPAFSVDGTVTPGSTATGAFTANWWQDTSAGTLLLQSNAPQVYQGTSDLTVETSPQSQLGVLLGAGEAGPDVLRQFNQLDVDDVALVAK
ncbi:MAG: hypothetical protein ACM31C_10935 [Acidobacteriota bacterium]